LELVFFLQLGSCTPFLRDPPPLVEVVPPCKSVCFEGPQRLGGRQVFVPHQIGRSACLFLSFRRYFFPSLMSGTRIPLDGKNLFVFGLSDLVGRPRWLLLWNNGIDFLFASAPEWKTRKPSFNAPKILTPPRPVSLSFPRLMIRALRTPRITHQPLPLSLFSISSIPLPLM